MEHLVKEESKKRISKHMRQARVQRQIQVRQQAMAWTDTTRKKFDEAKERNLKILADIVTEGAQNTAIQHIQHLTNLHDSAMAKIGMAHRAAAGYKDMEKVKSLKRLRDEEIAKQRGTSAMIKLAKDQESNSASKMAIVKRKEFVRMAEDKKSKELISRMPLTAKNSNVETRDNNAVGPPDFQPSLAKTLKVASTKSESQIKPHGKLRKLGVSRKSSVLGSRNASSSSDMIMRNKASKVQEGVLTKMVRIRTVHGERIKSDSVDLVGIEQLIGAVARRDHYMQPKKTVLPEVVEPEKLTVRYFDVAVPNGEVKYVAPEGLAVKETSSSPDAWEKGRKSSQKLTEGNEIRAQKEEEIIHKAAERGKMALKKARLEKQLTEVRNELLEEIDHVLLGSGSQTAILGLEDSYSLEDLIDIKAPPDRSLSSSDEFSAVESDEEFQFPELPKTLTTLKSYIVSKGKTESEGVLLIPKRNDSPEMSSLDETSSLDSVQSYSSPSLQADLSVQERKFNLKPLIPSNLISRGSQMIESNSLNKFDNERGKKDSFEESSTLEQRAHSITNNKSTKADIIQQDKSSSERSQSLSDEDKGKLDFFEITSTLEELAHSITNHKRNKVDVTQKHRSFVDHSQPSSIKHSKGKMDSFETLSTLEKLAQSMTNNRKKKESDMQKSRSSIEHIPSSTENSLNTKTSSGSTIAEINIKASEETEINNDPTKSLADLVLKADAQQRLLNKSPPIAVDHKKRPNSSNGTVSDINITENSSANSSSHSSPGDRSKETNSRSSDRSDSDSSILIKLTVKESTEASPQTSEKSSISTDYYSPPDGPFTSTPDGKLHPKRTLSNSSDADPLERVKRRTLYHYVDKFLARRPESIEKLPVSSSSSSIIQADSDILSSDSFQGVQNDSSSSTSNSQSPSMSSLDSKSRSSSTPSSLDITLRKALPTVSEEDSQLESSSTIAEATVKAGRISVVSTNSESNSKNDSVTSEDRTELNSSDSLTGMLKTLNQQQEIEKRQLNYDENGETSNEVSSFPPSIPFQRRREDNSNEFHGRRNSSTRSSSGSLPDVSLVLRQLRSRQHNRAEEGRSDSNESSPKSGPDREQKRLELLEDITPVKFWETPPRQRSQNETEQLSAVFENLINKWSNIRIEPPPWYIK